MSILVNRDSKVITQGITGGEGKFHTERCIEYGTKVVGGVTPGKGGIEVLGVPVFDTAAEAVVKTGADVSLIFVPAAFAGEAMMEAADAGIRLVICITEGIPPLDMVKVRRYLDERGVLLIGPNCPGILTPGECKVGIMPGHIATPGGVGVVSRSGTLTYETVAQLTEAGLGQSTCLGIGGDPIVGLSFVEVLRLFERDKKTEAVVMIGEIGGTAEEEAAELVKREMKKPVIAFIAGRTAPKGKRMGHAGAIISGGKGGAEDKIRALEAAGVKVVPSPSEIAATVAAALEEARSKKRPAPKRARSKSKPEA